MQRPSKVQHTYSVPHGTNEWTVARVLEVIQEHFAVNDTVSHIELKSSIMPLVVEVETKAGRHASGPVS